MKMTLRWFGPGYDSVKVEYIRQIPGVAGVITTLYGKQAGEVWAREEIRALKQSAMDAGLPVLGIESVNVSDAIKAGLPERDEHIDHYIQTLRALGEEGITLVCYNFMPVFDWTRTDLAKQRPDGSAVFSYDQALIDRVDYREAFASMKHMSGGFALPGWEPERLGQISALFDVYRDISQEDLFSNHRVFISALLPTLRKYHIRMALHPDDPAFSVFGLPRVMTGKQNLQRALAGVDDPLNGLTLCSGSLGTNPANDIPDIIASFIGRIHFAHIRNLLHSGPGCFEETAHLSEDGSMDIYALMKALYESGFDGPIRPDHGRRIWGENAMPGYGLYDRALGASYLQGLLEAIRKNRGEKA